MLVGKKVGFWEFSCNTVEDERSIVCFEFLWKRFVNATGLSVLLLRLVGFALFSEEKSFLYCNCKRGRREKETEGKK